MRRRALPMVVPYPGSRGLNSKTADGVCAFEHYHLVRFLKCQDCHINSFWVLLLLRVQIDDELFVDVFRDVRPCREIQELAGKRLRVKLDP